MLIRRYYFSNRSEFLADDFADNPQLRPRFEREARAASALNHPKIATVYDIAEDASRVFMAIAAFACFGPHGQPRIDPLTRLVAIANQINGRVAVPAFKSTADLEKAPAHQ